MPAPHWTRDFTIVEGEMPVVEALAIIAAAGKEWIVIRRFGSLLYVYKMKELREHPRLRGLWDAASPLQLPLDAALDLHEDQSSNSTHNPDESVTDPPPGRRPSIGRMTLVSGPGQPLAIAIPAADLPRASARPTRGMRRTRGTAHGSPPGSGPVLERAREGAAVTPMDTAPIGDEGTSPLRYPSIEPDGAPRPGQPIEITVDLVREPSPATSGGPVQPTDLPVDWSELPVGVQVLCTQIDFDQG